MRFFNFFVAYMVQKYQNESAPIFYYGKSPKTIRKHLNIPYLQALTLGRIIKMTLYYLLQYHPWEKIITGEIVDYDKVEEDSCCGCCTGW